MKSAVIVPTNRPERMAEFVKAWTGQFDADDVRLIVCEDHALPAFGLPAWVEHYCWLDIDNQLGDKASCIPRRSGGIRDFGFWLAGQDTGIDMMVSLDDDVLPLDDHFLADHWAALNTPRTPRWHNTMEGGQYPRGFPYGVRAGVKPSLNHGMWAGMPDIDAFTQLLQPASQCTQVFSSQLVPAGVYYSNCAMNFSFRREVAPLCYFPTLPDGMKRWDDIWSGLIFKRVADLHGWAVTTGEPCVRHNRASDPLSNLRQEMLGYGINERMWEVVDSAHGRPSPIETYSQVISAIDCAFPELKSAVQAMRLWISLWKPEVVA